MAFAREGVRSLGLDRLILPFDKGHKDETVTRGEVQREEDNRGTQKGEDASAPGASFAMSESESGKRYPQPTRDFYRLYSYAYKKTIYANEDILLVNLPPQVHTILCSVQFSTSLRYVHNNKPPRQRGSGKRVESTSFESTTRSSSSESSGDLSSRTYASSGYRNNPYSEHYKSVSVKTMPSFSKALTDIFRKKSEYGVVLAPFSTEFIRPLREFGYKGVVIVLSRSSRPVDAFMEGYDGLITKLSSRSIRMLAMVLQEVSVM